MNDINEKPVDMFISANSINENIAIGSQIAELRSADNDTNDTFTYSLIEEGEVTIINTLKSAANLKLVNQLILKQSHTILLDCKQKILGSRF